MTVCAKSLAAKLGLPLGIAAYGTGAGDTLGQMHTGQDGANGSLFVTNNARGITCCRILVVLFVLRRGARDVNAAHRVMVRFVIVVKSWVIISTLVPRATFWLVPAPLGASIDNRTGRSTTVPSVVSSTGHCCAVVVVGPSSRSCPEKTT